MSKTVDLARLKERALTALETYGSDQARWPEADRTLLAEIVASDPDLAAHKNEEQKLDDLLALSAVQPPSLRLQAHILGSFEKDRNEGVAGTSITGHAARELLKLLWPCGSVLIPAGAMAAALVMGSSVGLFTATTSTGGADDTAYEIVALAIGDTTYSEDWQ